jgi:hypothetical protein
MKKKLILISAAQREELRKISRSLKSESRLVSRAKIILCSSEGKSYDEIIDKTVHCRGSVAKW